jgi:hypothetical protein
MLLLLLNIAASEVVDLDRVGLPNLGVLGRTTSETVHFSWTRSTVEFDFHGTELLVHLDVEWSWATGGSPSSSATNSTLRHRSPRTRLPPGDHPRQLNKWRGLDGTPQDAEWLPI